MDRRGVRAFSERRAGVLLHLTSLPGPGGSGDLGKAAYDFVDWLVSARQSCWQMLPTVPPAGGASPYQSSSAFAIDPAFVDLDDLRARGLLDEPLPVSDTSHRGVVAYRRQHLEIAFDAFRRSEATRDFLAFVERERGWLDDFAVYSALKERHGDKPFYEWPEPERDRHDARLTEALADAELRARVRFHQFVQWIADEQWRRLRAHANERGVLLIGDVPIFVGHDSADVWAGRSIFQLDARAMPTVVAGVPPDYFSADGQLWGNVLYDVEAMRRTDWAWWISRLARALSLFDAVRLDHFIGFHRYWAVPYGEKTAKNGRYEPGPGRALFDALARRLGGTPAILAEDLGVVTDEVTALRRSLGFPGMQVLQFSFSPDRGARSTLPHACDVGTVVYTGTHDNDTTVGWWEALGVRAETDEGARAERANVLRYLDVTGEDIAWDLVRAAHRSHAKTAIVPMQDLLAQGTEARMNVPGKIEGNWLYRVPSGALTPALAEKLRALTELYARTP